MSVKEIRLLDFPQFVKDLTDDQLVHVMRLAGIIPGWKPTENKYKAIFSKQRKEVIDLVEKEFERRKDREKTCRLA